MSLNAGEAGRREPFSIDAGNVRLCEPQPLRVFAEPARNFYVPSLRYLVHA